jgi:hypothetical protein
MSHPGRSKKFVECFKAIIDLNQDEFCSRDIWPVENRMLVAPLKKAGHIMPAADRRGRYVITKTGRQYARLQGWIE